MINLKKDFEQRKHRRFKAPGDAYAALLPDSVLGQIINISKKGLTLRYIANGERINGSRKMDVFSYGNDFYLRKVPFKFVWDFYLDNEFPFSTIIMRQCGGHFGELTPAQIFQLEYFLTNCTTGRL